ncbi:shikimate kinase [Cytophaga hutchinsonii]|jgi:shikimate kinase|uniref:Shikimate kinase n=1 Tax=Cytophaga hutchinsonii (strain ATCC 33406 / DSM 1761 / CIP 103989 / NBRC 15051 / NCIMB 9469 / D465) TaxID=269798 RepID=A0A6N4SVB9_CYTH3|nr:shikimate kinase [Cytophaga hutchinsonii]ABG60466.1 shikimate kinase [Cytophaga hutchinsonii ATCC 33406]SFX85354.1 shikimate kinase [Cytophaga hutchinsonii ATCC 33406]
MLIYLIGLPGSGKSTIGKTLAQKLKYTFFDMDDAICAQEKKTIEEIFADKGENYFRELEHSILHDTFELKNAIISTGGGVPCYFDNITEMKKHGLTIFINPSADELANRLVGQGGQNRPMLKGKTHKQVLDFIETKYRERAPYYEQAKLIFSTNKLNAEELLKHLKKEKLIS